jgi:hypothetical protein
VVRLDAGFEIRAHEMTRATLQALLKNHSRYDIRQVTKYRPAAHVVRETARVCDTHAMRYDDAACSYILLCTYVSLLCMLVGTNQC